jgi:hypothetical protein
MLRGMCFLWFLFVSSCFLVRNLRKKKDDRRGELIEQSSNPNSISWAHLEGYVVSMRFELFVQGPPGFPSREVLDHDSPPSFWAVFDIFKEVEFKWDKSTKELVRKEGPIVYQGYAPLDLSRVALEESDF